MIYRNRPGEGGWRVCRNIWNSPPKQISRKSYTIMVPQTLTGNMNMKLKLIVEVVHSFIDKKRPVRSCGGGFHKRFGIPASLLLLVLG